MIIHSGAGFGTRSVRKPRPRAHNPGLRGIREWLAYSGSRLDIASQPALAPRAAFLVPRHGATLSPPLHLAPNLEAGGKPKTSTRDAPNRRIRVLLADDHKILRDGLASLLGNAPDIDVVGEAEDGLHAVELSLELEPDVVIMDVTMPRMNGIEATRKITSALPHVRVIGLSMHEEADMANALSHAGAIGYLTKGGPANDLIEAIRHAGSLPASRKN